MKPSECDRCGLRAVRHELERNGIIMRFCDDCYWGEVSEAGTEPTTQEPAGRKKPPEPTQPT
ncbi:MAG TPA: hypothetical protein VKZ50_05900 [bacterium]|nr:hypothetical protein [bacterium]